MLKAVTHYELARWLWGVFAFVAIHLCVGIVAARAEPPLVAAIQAHDADRFDALVAAGTGVNSRDGEGLTPLMHAVLSGEVYFVEGLIRAGADPSARDPEGRSPLHYAVFTNEAIVTSLLYWRGALELRDESGRTPLLTLAAEPQGDPTLLRLLLDRGADPAAVDAAEATALITAARSGASAEALTILCQADPTLVDAMDAQGNTALRYLLGGLDEAGVTTAVETHQRGIHALLDCGADVNLEVDGRLPLELAASNLHLRGSSAYWRINDLTDRSVGLSDQGGAAEIHPRPTRLLRGEQESFTLEAAGAPVRSVRWQASLGEISPDGIYHATTPGNESITAINRENEQESATLRFVVEEP